VNKVSRALVTYLFHMFVNRMSRARVPYLFHKIMSRVSKARVTFVQGPCSLPVRYVCDHRVSRVLVPYLFHMFVSRVSRAQSTRKSRDLPSMAATKLAFFVPDTVLVYRGCATKSGHTRNRCLLFYIILSFKPVFCTVVFYVIICDVKMLLDC
jgi:hypothetical protein